MKTANGFRLIPAATLVVLLGCATTSPPPPVEPGPSVQSPAATKATLDGRVGLAQLGRDASALLRERYPSYAKGRLAVGWSDRNAFMATLGGGLAEAWPGAESLSEIGVNVSDQEEAFSQLDPSTFSGLLWISPRVEERTLKGLSFLLRFTSGGLPDRWTVDCRPALALEGAGEGIPSRAGIHRSHPLPDRVKALGWESGPGRLWVALSNQVEIRDPVTFRTLAGVPLPPAPEDRPPGRAVLQEVTNAGSRIMVWFDLGRGEGRSFIAGPGGSIRSREAPAGFPLSARVSQFFTAPFDEGSALFALTDFRGNELGLCRDIVRFQGPYGSLFAFLGEDGSVGVFSGADFSVVNGPTPDPASAIASLGRDLVLASARFPAVLTGFAMTKNYVWRRDFQVKLEGACTALCGAVPGGRPALFAAEDAPGGGTVLISVLPGEGARGGGGGHSGD